MKLQEAIEFKTKELLRDYKEVNYSHNEIIQMTSNYDRSKYLSEQLPSDSQVIEIKNRFEELDKENYIDAVKLIFNVKPPRKRKYIEKEVYYKIIQKEMITYNKGVPVINGCDKTARELYNEKYR